MYLQWQVIDTFFTVCSKGRWETSFTRTWAMGNNRSWGIVGWASCCCHNTFRRDEDKNDDSSRSISVNVICFRFNSSPRRPHRLVQRSSSQVLLDRPFGCHELCRLWTSKESNGQKWGGSSSWPIVSKESSSWFRLKFLDPFIKAVVLRHLSLWVFFFPRYIFTEISWMVFHLSTSLPFPARLDVSFKFQLNFFLAFQFLKSRHWASLYSGKFRSYLYIYENTCPMYFARTSIKVHIFVHLCQPPPLFSKLFT